MKALNWRVALVASAILTSLLAVGLSLPPFRNLIEQSMVWHMVIQMPLLVLGGGLCLQAMVKRPIGAWLAPWNRYGLTGFLLAQGIIAYWMLPLAIDRAVVEPQADGLKLVSLLICGGLLQHSFIRAPVAVQLFFVGASVTMMLTLGRYFVTTDLRLCNAYSLQSQINTGHALVLLGLALGVAWGLSLRSHLNSGWPRR
jgi:hypothetical protein